MKKKTVGTGITKRETVSFDTNTKEGWDSLRKFLDRDFSFEGLQGDTIEKWARGVLEEAGLAEPGADLFEVAALPIGDSDPDSAEGYAVRLIRKLRLVRALIEQQCPAEMAVRFGGELVGLAVEAAMKFRWEEDALSSVNRRRDFEAGRYRENERRKRNAEEQSEILQAIADKIKEKYPNWSPHKVAKRIKELQPDSPSVRTIWKYIK